MKKIKDRITLGIITGIAGSIPIQIIDAFIHKLGITDVPYAYSASKIFLNKKKTKTPGGKAVSAVINFINAGLTSTALTYVFSLTGKDKPYLKGASIGTLLWVMIAGLLSNIGLNIRSKKPVTPIISLGEHILFGTICAYLIITLGSDRLFPDSSNRKREETKIGKEKIPVVNTGKDTTTEKSQYIH